MYWGEGTIYAATSEDLIRWQPVEADTSPDKYLNWDPDHHGPMGHWQLENVPGAMGLRPIAEPRRTIFDSLLTEPGPPALVTPAGIILIYNGANHFTDGDPGAPPLAYQPGQLLLDAHDPTAVIRHMRDPFLRIDAAEAHGQVGNACFAEGFVAFRGQWLLYVGLADSRLGVSSAPISGD